MTDAERMINVGVSVELKHLGMISVKEPSLEDIIALGSELAIIMDKVELDEEGGGMGFLVNMLAQEHTKQAVFVVAGKSCGRKPEEFKDMGITDWLKWLDAFKQAVEWEELKNLFFQVFGKEAIGEALRKRRDENKVKGRTKRRSPI